MQTLSISSVLPFLLQYFLTVVIDKFYFPKKKKKKLKSHDYSSSSTALKYTFYTFHIFKVIFDFGN